MIRVNLLPQKRGPNARRRQPTRRWLLVVLGVVVVEIVGLFLFHQVKREELAKQKRTTPSSQPDRPDQEGSCQPRRLKAQLEVLRAREDAIAKLQKRAQPGPTAVLLELARCSPPVAVPPSTPIPGSAEQ